MYTAVLMLAMTAGAETIDHGRRNCNGCCACYGSYASCCSYSGCCGGGYYRAGYGSYYGPGPYYASGTYYSPNVMVQGAANDVRRSFYPNVSPNEAMIRVLLPTSDAEVWFDGAPTRQRGLDRLYSSPGLEPGNYKYTIKGRWTEDGRTVNRERTVEVQPGQPRTVDFRMNAGENVPAPKTNSGQKTS